MDSLKTKRAEATTQRRADMPKIYRATYDKAVSGRSLRAAVNSFCLECVCWQRVEVALCTSLACPLYAVRPYRSSQNPQDEGFSERQSTNGGQAVLGAVYDPKHKIGRSAPRIEQFKENDNDRTE